LISADIVTIIVKLELAIIIRAYLLPDYLPFFLSDDIQKYYWILVLTILYFIYEKIYFIRYDFFTDIKRVFKALLLSLVTVLTVITLSKISLDYSRSFLIIFFMLAIFIFPISKRLVKRFIFRFKIFKIKVNVISKDMNQYKKIKQELKNNWYFGFKFSKNQYDMILIVSKSFKADELQEMIKKNSRKTKDIYIVPYLEHLDLTHTSIIDYSNIRLSAIHIENRLLNFKNLFIKSFIEKFFIFLCSPFILFLHLLISIAVKVDSSGPVRFKQKRFGKNAKSFSCYKYRTMYINNDNILEKYLRENPEEVEYYNIYHKYKNDPRITKVGKFLRKTSLDEFPQFFNILRGDMNLIGPRPYMLNEQEKIGKHHEEVILEVKPGITGLWQVSGRNELKFKERLDLDKWYIQNWSLWLDFVIFMKTIKVVLLKVGAK
ncbi:MAG: sugar transferase, partial [Arcobacter sp.]|nr:sugar transferase [Arcobacter sp.]